MKEPGLELSTPHITEMRAKFAAGFDDLCSHLTLGHTIQELSRRWYMDYEMDEDKTFRELGINPYKICCDRERVRDTQQ